MKDNFKILSEVNENIRILCHLSATDDNDNDLYFIIAIKPLLYQKFKTLNEIDDSTIEEYGEIIFSGEGTEPSGEEVKELKEKLGANFKFEYELEEIIAEAKAELETIKESI